MRRKIKGVLNGIIASVSYGTNPLFALPLYSKGIGVNSVLFYRYAFAVIIYGLWLKLFKKTSLKINLQEGLWLLFFGLLFSGSSLTLFDAFNYIDAGLACTILFVYPIMVAIIMAIFFKEKITATTVLSIGLTSFGIFLLYNGGEKLNLHGVGLVIASALLYALYIVGVKNVKAVKHLKSDKLTFYVMLFGMLLYIINLNFCTELQILQSPLQWLCAIALAIIPTIISLETITVAIKFVGSTTTAILGALEPLTAIFFGVTIFHEELTTKICFGILLILSGVLFLVTNKIRK
ncbi:MAG: DMT family transporter [Candidatus Gastranaerophilales bacterium]|nr:DMT family transporter [Candidatus Gastranaerophilales bacterium]MCM1073946.1 DMT family transporter [Bacteroides sp.]